MKEGFNLSGWAIQRQSLVIFLVVLSAIAGILAYINLGRDEDPEFTFATMIVSAGWPGGRSSRPLIRSPTVWKGRSKKCSISTVCAA